MLTTSVGRIAQSLALIFVSGMLLAFVAFVIVMWFYVNPGFLDQLAYCRINPLQPQATCEAIVWDVAVSRFTRTLFGGF